MELRCKQKREKRKKVKKQKQDCVAFLGGAFFIFAYLLVFVPGMDTLNSEA